MLKITSIFLALLFASTSFALIPANLNLVYKNLVPNASITTSTVSSAIDLQEYEGEISVYVDTSAKVAGTNPTLAVKLTHCDTSGGSYSDVTSGAFGARAATAVFDNLTFNKNGLKRFVKLDWTIGGTDSPEYYISSKVIGMKKQQ